LYEKESASSLRESASYEKELALSPGESASSH
jgi:hypothetical protein